MWVLVGTGENEGSQHWLAPGKSYSIGRKDCDINISNDRSVSRKHGTLTVSENSISAVSDTKANTVVTLIDERSKFGLYVNQDKISEQTLQDGDEIKFGAMNSTYKLEFKKLVLCCSGMRATTKKQLATIASELDVKLVDSWSSECTHLIMQNIQVTQKVLFALLSCCYIVKDQWLGEIYKNKNGLEEHFSLPEEKEFLPPVKEKIIDPNSISFLPNQNRRGLFKAKTFIVFSSSQLPKISEPVEIGGGEAVCYEGGVRKLDAFIAQHNDPIFIRPPENSNKDVVEYLASLDKDLISEMDIGFAILHGTLNFLDKSDTTSSTNVSETPVIESVEPKGNGSRTTRTQSKLDSFLKPNLAKTATTISPQLQPSPFARPEVIPPKRVSARELSSSIMGFSESQFNSHQENGKSSQSTFVDIPNTMESFVNPSIKKEPVVEVFSYGTISPSQTRTKASQSVSPGHRISPTLKSTASKPMSARDFSLSLFRPKTSFKKEQDSQESKPNESQEFTRKQPTADRQLFKPLSSQLDGDTQQSPLVHPKEEEYVEVKPEVMEVNKIRNMAQVEFDDLIVKRKQRTSKTTYSGPNFKRFTKGYYPERDRNTLPTVVELVLHDHSIGAGADEQWLRTAVKTNESQDDSDMFGLHDQIGKTARKRKASRI
ncbi:hypothetical protein K7432_010424 [Basidiobolus ranarum]|uniref:FHA domain-containing protein n=1 Tax=Basidiobolus ranarum TaxID=34480 RepID=A0ABR2VVG2_9FUNG